MKVFISQPMRGRTETEIERVRDNIKMLLENHFNINGGDSIDFTYNDAETPKSYCDEKALAYSINELVNSQLAVFTEDWYRARGCKVEHEICDSYGIPNIEVNKDGTYFSTDDWRFNTKDEEDEE